MTARYWCRIHDSNVHLLYSHFHHNPNSCRGYVIPNNKPDGYHESFCGGFFFIFSSVAVVLKHKFFYQHYLILDTLSQILSGPDSCLLGDIIVHIKVWGAQ